GSEPYERRPGKIATIAGCRHGSECRAGRDTGRPSCCAEEDRDEIRDPESHQAEAKDPGYRMRDDKSSGEAESSEAAGGTHEGDGTDPPRQPITAEAADGHGQREGREAHGGDRRRRPHRVAQVDRAPGTD